MPLFDGVVNNPAPSQSGTSVRSWLVASRFLAAASGTPTQTNVGSATRPIPGWLLDAAAAESVHTSFDIPDSWATVDVDVWWINAGAGAGDVVWRLDWHKFAAGDSAQAVDTSTSLTTSTAGAQNIIVVTTIASGIAFESTKLNRVEVVRLATDAADTLANDAGFLGVMLRKAS